MPYYSTKNLKLKVRMVVNIKEQAIPASYNIYVFIGKDVLALAAGVGIYVLFVIGNGGCSSVCKQTCSANHFDIKLKMSNKPFRCIPPLCNLHIRDVVCFLWAYFFADNKGSLRSSTTVLLVLRRSPDLHWGLWIRTFAELLCMRSSGLQVVHLGRLVDQVDFSTDRRGGGPRRYIYR